MERVDYSEELISARKRFGERNDCSVTAWANTFDCSYEKAHSWLKRHGRRDKKGVPVEYVRNALKACRLAKVVFGPYSRDNKISLKKFCEKHPVGRYYVIVRGHAFCVKDGVVHDWYSGPRHMVTFAARVYLKGEI